MADTQTKTDGKASSAKAKEEPKEPRFPRERIIAEADVLLGENRKHIVAGAMADLKGKSEITLAEARKAVETYRNRRLKEDS